MLNNTSYNQGLLRGDRVFIEILKRLDKQNDGNSQIYTVFGVWVLVITTKCLVKKFVTYLWNNKIKKKNVKKNCFIESQV